jgi:hypothetical protein
LRILKETLQLRVSWPRLQRKAASIAVQLEDKK